MITLYHAPRSRSSRFIFLLEELGAPYEIAKVNIRRGDGSGALDSHNPHPHGKVPAIRDGDSLVYESPAIALYLTDKFPAAGIGPVVGDPNRGAYLTWLAYYGGVMEPAWTSAFMKMDVPRGTAGWVKTDEVMELVNTALSKNPYILGEKFSAADILLGTTFKLFMGSPLLPKSDLLESYVNRVVERPAYGRAAAKDAEIINLRRARKAKDRAQKEKTAQANRVLHGTPKHLRKLTEAEKNKAEQQLAGKRLEQDDEDK